MILSVKGFTEINKHSQGCIDVIKVLVVLNEIHKLYKVVSDNISLLNTTLMPVNIVCNKSYKSVYDELFHHLTKEGGQ